MVTLPTLDNATGAFWLSGRVAVWLGLREQFGSALWDQALWGQAEWAGAVGWVDVTCYCRGFSIDRGRQSELEHFDAGRAVVELVNTDQRFSPWNPRSPYTGALTSQLRPGTPMAIAAGFVPSDDFYDQQGTWDEAPPGTLPWDGTVQWCWLFVGTTESIGDDWPGTVDARAIFTVTETQSDLGTYNLTLLDAAQWAGDPTGQRITNLLTEAEWRWGSQLDVGTCSMRPTLLGAQAIDLIHLAADTEGGAVWTKGDGSLRFGDLNWTPGNSVATFTDRCVSGKHPYLATPVMVTDGDLLANVVTIAATNDTPTVRRDQQSVDVHGVWDFTRTDLEMENTGQAARLADVTLQRRAWLTTHVDALDVDYDTDHTLFPTLSMLDLRDKITFERTIVDPVTGEVSIVLDMTVAGLAHEVTPEHWHATIRTSPYFTRDQLFPPIYGEEGWDVGRWSETAWQTTGGLRDVALSAA
jgi:hypothetical protein